MQNINRILFSLLLGFSTVSYGQYNTYIESSDEIIFNKIEEQNFETEVDLDQYVLRWDDEKKEDYTKIYMNLTPEIKAIVYLYPWGETNFIYTFYLDKKSNDYTPVLFTNYSSSEIEARQKDITLTQNRCCGESVVRGKLTIHFNEEGISFIENYGVVDSYNNVKHFEVPDYSPYYSTVKWGIIQNEGYNLRSYPSMEKHQDEDFNSFFNANGEYTIAKIKKNTRVKILDTVDLEDRTWLYVEVNPENFSEDNVSAYLYNSDQNIRAWISANFVTLE
ncbi:hypothetical protein M2306_000175 [Myroides gitamensis]|uniref:Uncharacterized protein n=1 Tax=Myroides odoratus TaxID=256 RepID=A0A378RPY6_MYROD|nr:hypothetical protein [Myroides odoratus]MCS4239213.1 hypothetical protein [Myroides odoratus]MDH6599481.1 hypothetical protein [Myroides gitamensis]QQU04180.1 hypothetical protein I6I89_02500 [Myroides odoratus]STZ28419.1 Uncharacterised protein [Myroides odoratus]